MTELRGVSRGPGIIVLGSTTAQRALYELLRRKVRDPTAEFVDEFPLADGWWTFVHESEAILRSGHVSSA
jgi:hypothetical protein